MIILSLDALGGEDFKYLKTLPTFAEFLEEAAVCTNVRTIYPSVTYPCHATIVTGKYPKHHGVINNTLVQPNRPAPDWFWQRKYIKAETLFDLAIKKGMKVGAFLWPVTANSKIQYNIPEIFPNRWWDNQVLVSLRSGSPQFILELHKKFAHLLDGIKQPALDDFVTASVVHTIKTKAPELLLVHLTDLDTMRHQYGVHSKEAYQAIDRLGTRFLAITQALKEASLYSETAIILLGDHTQIDVKREVNLGQVLLEKGYLTVKNHKLRSWRILAKSCGGSAYIYVQPGFHQEAEKLLQQLKNDPAYGIERIFTNEEVIAAGADPNCYCMVEAVSGVVFADTWTKGVKEKVKKADHGYQPDKPQYRTFFASLGPGIKKQVKIEEMSLTDIAPTLAELMDLDLQNPDGRVLTEIKEDTHA